MGVLQDFERRLEGAVEGFFARAFRSGLQPVELAKALQRYAEDTQHVTEDGVVVPNVYRFRLNHKDDERLKTFGDELRDELAEVVRRTADERRWILRGPVVVRTEVADEVAFGMYELTARVEAVEGHERAAATPARGDDAPSAAPAPSARTSGPALRVVSGGERDTIRLTGNRLAAGRLAAADVTLDDGTVSREHAAFVKRNNGWWVIDLGSTNGTQVNGISAAEHALRDGDRITLGEAVLEYVET